MRKLLNTLLLMTVISVANAQIVADHTVVDQYDNIPQQYIDAVKTMLVSIPGESHSEAYRLGMELLELLDNTYQAEIYDLVAPPASTDQYVRIGRHRKAGEDYFFSEAKILEMKNDIYTQNLSGNPFDVIGFGWCWDMVWQNAPGGGLDPVHHVRWAGSTEGGPDGNMRWGLDSDDQALTGNSVSMDTYLEAVESYIQFCADSSYVTKWVFTTGPVDSWVGNEAAFQRELKHEHIRDYVAQDPSRILFDYGDILCWSNDGEQYLMNWNDGGTLRPHANIHPENMMDYDASWNISGYSEDGDHIGEVGALRIAKAMWWMLARMAGWDGAIPLTEVEVRSEGNSTAVMTGSQLQFFAVPTPLNATDTTVSWRVVNGTGTASISSAGLLKGGLPGMVDVLALARDGSGAADTMALTITPPLVPVNAIAISSAGGISEIGIGGTLQCSASVLPENASNKTVKWTVVNLTGSALVSANGLVSGVTAGTVDVIATAEDGSLVADTFQLVIRGSEVLVSDVDIASAGGATQIVSGGELQFSATVLPVNATNPLVSWSVVLGTGSATINSEGLLRGYLPGLVDVVALARDGSGESDTLSLTIIPPGVPVTGIAMSSAGGISEIETGSSLQFSASVLPVNATNPSILWIVDNISGSATITPEGRLTGGFPGLVNVVALAQDGTGVSDHMDLYITAPQVPVTDITVFASGGATRVEPGTTIQFSADIVPADASNPSVSWKVVNGSGVAAITAGGWVTGVTEGVVDVVATALDGSGTNDSYTLTIASPAILVSGIDIVSAGNLNEVDEGSTLQFSATVVPVEASNRELVWSVINGSGSASITSGGLATALTAGTVTIVATAQDGSDEKDEFTLTISGPNSLPDAVKNSHMVLYPNPSGGIFYLDAGDLQIQKIEVISAQGSVVLELLPKQGEKLIEVDLSDQQPGAFFIHTFTKTQSVVQRAILMR